MTGMKKGNQSFYAVTSAAELFKTDWIIGNATFYTDDAGNVVLNDSPADIDSGDILYICSEKHYLLYYTADNALVPYKERGTIAEKEIEFYAYRFIRPHQRYLVNVNHIDRFDCASNTITLTTGEQLPISKAMKDEAFRKYKEYKRK